MATKRTTARAAAAAVLAALLVALLAWPTPGDAAMSVLGDLAKPLLKPVIDLAVSPVKRIMLEWVVEPISYEIQQAIEDGTASPVEDGDGEIVHLEEGVTVASARDADVNDGQFEGVTRKRSDDEGDSDGDDGFSIPNPFDWIIDQVTNEIKSNREKRESKARAQDAVYPKRHASPPGATLGEPTLRTANAPPAPSGPQPASSLSLLKCGQRRSPPSASASAAAGAQPVDAHLLAGNAASLVMRLNGFTPHSDVVLFGSQSLAGEHGLPAPVVALDSLPPSSLSFSGGGEEGAARCEGRALGIGGLMATAGMGLDSPHKIVVIVNRTNGDGVTFVQRMHFTPRFCAGPLYFQAMDMSTCELSPVVNATAPEGA